MPFTNASNDSNGRRIVIATGGTAGHVHPALAVADAYRELRPEASILFVGTPNGFESELVPARGYPLTLIPGSPLFHVGPAGKVRAFWNLARGIHAARRLLVAGSAELVLGFGGYAAAGTILAARSLGVPAVIHEANAAPGLTNRLLGRIVQRVHLGCESARPFFPARRTRVTGTPVRAEVLRAAEERRRRAAAGERPHRVLVTGGSLGSAFLNQRAPDLLERVARKGLPVEVRHQTGRVDPEPICAAYRKAALPALVVPYIDDMAGAYGWADFVVGCAGAVTIAELAAVGLPALLVPLAAASEDHQQANARALDPTAGFEWVAEADWQAEALAARVAAKLRARPGAGTGVPASVSDNAARAIVEDCEALLGL